MSAVLDSFMHTRDNFSGFIPLFGTFRLFREFALNLGESLFLFAKESRVINKRTIGQSSKLFKPDINTDSVIRDWQRLTLDFTGKTDIPFAILSADGAGFNLSFYRPVEFYLYIA